MRASVLAACLATASSFQLPQTAPRAAAPRAAQAPQMGLKAPAAAAGAALALMLANSNPALTQAAVEPPAVVQRYGSSMVADASEAELRDAQRKFLEERAKIKQEYDTDTESTFINADEVADKKSIYVTIVGGLIVVAFVAPMLQFFYYTGGD